ncbi:MAG: YqzE family protein [Caldibacillus sp.]
MSNSEAGMEKMKTNDYVKFLTETIISHLDTPKDVREEAKKMRKQQDEALLYKIFGTMPYMFMTGVKMAKKRRGIKPPLDESEEMKKGLH